MFRNRKGIDDLTPNLPTGQISAKRIPHLSRRQKQGAAPVHRFASLLQIKETDGGIEQCLAIVRHNVASAGIVLLQIRKHRQCRQGVNFLWACAQAQAVKEIPIPPITSQVTMTEWLVAPLFIVEHKVAKITQTSEIFIGIE